MRGCFISFITLGIKMLCLAWVCRRGVIRVNASSLALSLPTPFQQSCTPPYIFRAHLFWDNKFTSNLNLSDFGFLLNILFWISYPDIIFGRWSILKDLGILDSPPPPSLFDFLSSLFASSSSTSTATLFFFLYLVPHLSLSLFPRTCIMSLILYQLTHTRHVVISSLELCLCSTLK